MSSVFVWIGVSCLVLSLSAQADPRKDALGDPLPDAAVARYGSSRLRNPGPIQALAWSPDGRLIASAAMRDDCRIRLWDAKTGRLVRVFGDPLRSINCLSFSADGKTIAGGTDGRVHLWDVESGTETAVLDPIPKKDRDEYEQTRKFGGIGPPPKTHTVVFAPDGKTLVAGTFHRRLLYDVKGCSLSGAPTIQDF